MGEGSRNVWYVPPPPPPPFVSSSDNDYIAHFVQ